MKLQLPKGTQDYQPKDKIIRNEITQTLQETFEEYGFSPLETPIIERYEILAAKFTAGEESDVMHEVFTFKDQGQRKLGLRYELTFPLARYIGMNPSIKFPFKRYQIGQVFRDGPIKLGRMRQFYQCDVDIVGSKNTLADAEILALTQAAFKKLNLQINIEVNTRKILNGILNYAEIKEKDHEQALIILDKLKKIGASNVKKELKAILTPTQIQKIIKLLNKKPSLDTFLKLEQTKEGALELQELFQYLRKYKVSFNFTPTLVRGLSYYTGPIYEVFLKKSKITSSVAGGGRWDNMIKDYLNNKQIYPATGISFGLEPILEEIKNKDAKETVTQVYIIPIGLKNEAIPILQELRENNIKTDIDLLKRGISKNLDYANKLNIPYVIFLGKQELKQKKVKLRDMKTGKESLLTVKELINKL